MALAIFFLLLTSLSEHIQFGTAYLIATLACLSLLAYYLRFVLGAWKEAVIFTSSLAALYGVLFVIVGAEDFALLMGSILIFVVLAGIMIVTRHIDWYQLRKSSEDAGVLPRS
jgi:inner membrane protein